MIVHASNITPRLEFVLQVLTSHLGIKFEIVESSDAIDLEKPFVNYSQTYIENSLWIIPSGLLFETGIPKEDIPIDEPKKRLFPNHKEGAYGFDIFSAIFYMLSRIEEYMPFKGDEHGRFSSSESMMGRLNSLKVPLVDDWILEFGNTLKKQFCEYPVCPDYQYIPTVDVDIAFAYRHRPLWMTLGHYAKDLLKGDFNKIKTRFNVNVGLKEDPYNTFYLLKETYQKDEAYMFFQVGYRGEYDKNMSPWHPEMKKLIYNCNQWANVGLHPSYQSNSKQGVVEAEKKILDDILNESTQLSRQHFLMLSFPDTYQNLLKAGFRSDFTLGFAESIGFRAGTAHPFPFYDLENESVTDLMLYPLAIMDGSLKDYMGLTQKEAKQEIAGIISEIKRVNGVFVSLWHNSSFSEIEGWNDWLEVFKFMHEEAKA